MALWQICLLALVAAWIVQSFGVWLQMQHYQKTFGELRSRWSDGALGAGAAPGRLGKGVIALLVICPAGQVRQLRLMQGRSVFAQFKDRTDLEGLTLGELKAKIASKDFERGPGLAIGKAIEQIEKVGGEKIGGSKAEAGTASMAA